MRCLICGEEIKSAANAKSVDQTFEVGGETKIVQEGYVHVQCWSRLLRAQKGGLRTSGESISP